MKFTQDLNEKLVLLLATAAIAGFLVPFILQEAAQTKALQQKATEAAIARQARIIEAQSKFLDDASEALWAWRYLSMKVAFSAVWGSPAEYENSVTEYRKGIWDALNRIRIQCSKSRRLLSEGSHKMLVALYDDIAALDSQLDTQARKPIGVHKTGKEMEQMHKKLRENMTDRIDEVLHTLARDAQLAADSIKGLP